MSSTLSRDKAEPSTDSEVELINSLILICQHFHFSTFSFFTIFSFLLTWQLSNLSK
jgi:hypothetical protein